VYRIVFSSEHQGFPRVSHTIPAPERPEAFCGERKGWIAGQMIGPAGGARGAPCGFAAQSPSRLSTANSIFCWIPL